MWRRRAETGLGPILKRQPGIYGYYIVRFGEGGGSISLFDSAETAEAAHQQALGWIKENLAGLGGGIEPEVSMGEVLGHVSA
jgi:hypothetical protein